MFDHSIKVPRLYKSASKIAKDVADGKGSIKQLVYEGNHPNIKALYALVCQTFQKTNDIEILLKKSKLLTKEPRLDPWLAKILMTELLWGKKRLSHESKPIKTILAYEQIFKAHLSDESLSFPSDLQTVDKPRYVRINTLKISVNEAVESFRDEGWVLKRFLDQSYEAFLQAVAELSDNEFMVDLHIPDLLIFPPKTQFYKHEAYKNGSIILQDKASCLPVHILNPEPGSTILDMCSAPGMKTTHAAAKINNTGVVYAVEMGPKRFETLKKIVSSAGATCVKPINRDVLTITAKECPTVDYIIVDPSCSGSGLTDRVEVGQQSMDLNMERLNKLAGFQIKILRHAMSKFPHAKRIVYSTCSLFAEENEDVVRQALETCNTFKLVSAGDFVGNMWMNYGSADFGEIGPKCLYSKPEIDLTSGFFVAVFQRLDKDEVNEFYSSNLRMFSKKQEREEKRKERKRHMAELEEQRMKSFGEFGVADNVVKNEENGGAEEVVVKSEKKKKKRQTEENSEVFVKSEKIERQMPNEEMKELDISLIKSENEENIVKSERKSKKRKNKEDSIDVKVEFEENEIKIEKKSKKRKKDKEENEIKSEDISNLSLDGNKESQNKVSKSQKKNKKHKNEDLNGNDIKEEIIEDVNKVEETLSKQETQKTKKKNKNRKISTEEIEPNSVNNNTLIELEQEENIKNLEKKDKRQKVVEVKKEEIVKKEKKKKNRKSEAEQIDENISNKDFSSKVEIEEEITNKKVKKNKKQKNERLEDSKSEEVDVSNTKSKKKKKQKSENS